MPGIYHPLCDWSCAVHSDFGSWSDIVLTGASQMINFIIYQADILSAWCLCINKPFSKEENGNDKYNFFCLLKNGIKQVFFVKLCTEAGKSEISVESSVLCHTGWKGWQQNLVTLDFGRGELFIFPSTISNPWGKELRGWRRSKEEVNTFEQ